jgi:hypothetical protein
MLPSYHLSRRGKPDAGFALFEGECLKWPGFVEFDDVNGKVLAFTNYDPTYYEYEAWCLTQRCSSVLTTWLYLLWLHTFCDCTS